MNRILAEKVNGMHTFNEHQGLRKWSRPLVILLVAVSLGDVARADQTSVLPLEATGVLGVLETKNDRPQNVFFNTSTGTYSIDGVEKNNETHRRSVDIATDPSDPLLRLPLWAFDFQRMYLGPSTTVTAHGENPLIILSQGSALIEATFLLDGKPGDSGGKGAGGGGGGGGGVIVIFAHGSLKFSGRISVDGGPGGIGNFQESNGSDRVPSKDAVFHAQAGAGGGGAAVMGSSENVLFDGLVSAVSPGPSKSASGSLAIVGKVEFGPAAMFNDRPLTRYSEVIQLLPGVSAATFVVWGSGGGGGGGGGGLHESNPTGIGYARASAAGGLPGPGGGSGGQGGYAAAGGSGSAGGNAGFGSGGTAGGGGGYLGTPGLGGRPTAGILSERDGALGGAGKCDEGGGVGGRGAGQAGFPGNKGEQGGTGAGSGGGRGTGLGGTGANANAGVKGDDGAANGGGGGGGGGVNLGAGPSNGGDGAAAAGTGANGGGGGGGGGDACGTNAEGTARDAGDGGGGGDGNGAGTPGAPGGAGKNLTAGVPTFSKAGLVIAAGVFLALGIAIVGRRRNR